MIHPDRAQVILISSNYPCLEHICIFMVPKVFEPLKLLSIKKGPNDQKNDDLECESKPMKRPGPGCSKLTTSLVNVSLKFQTIVSQIRQYFLLKKCEKLFSRFFFFFFFFQKISVYFLIKS